MSFEQYETSPYSGTPERLFLFTMGNRQWAYVNHAEPVVRGALTYQPEVISMGNIVQDLNEAPPSIEITMAATAEVAQQFIPYQPVFPMQVSVFRRHRDDPDAEYLIEMMGDVAAVAFDEEEGMCVFTCRMVSSNLDRKAPWPIYQGPCNYALYGPGCQVNKEAYKVETAVSDVQETDIFSTDFASKPDGWFRTGFVRRESTGEVRFIIDHVGNKLTLQTPFVDLDPGDAVTAYAGCNRLYDTCVSKFSNGHRYAGFEWIPQKNPFADNVYGTGGPGGSGLTPDQILRAFGFRR